MTSIGRRCRDGDVHSRAILITRTLSEACPDNGAGRKKKLIREPYVRHPPPWMRKRDTVHAGDSAQMLRKSCQDFRESRR